MTEKKLNLASEKNTDSYPKLPRKMLTVAALILLGLVAVFALRNSEHEREQVLRGMQDRADVLIWALEGGSRFMRHMGEAPEAFSPRRMANNPLAALLQETAKQPDVAYIALIDSSGKVLMHSNPAKTGMVLPDYDFLKTLQENAPSTGRFVNLDEESIYEVYKPFTPGRVHNFKRHGHMGQGRLQEKHSPETFKNADPATFGELATPSCPACSDSNSTVAPNLPAPYNALLQQPDLNSGHGPTHMNTLPPNRSEKHMTRGSALPPERAYILVGLDATWFEKHLRTYTLNTVIMAGLVALAGLAGLALLFLIHNYTLSRRMLKDTKVMAGHIVHNLPLGLISTDENGRINLVNPNACLMFDLTANEFAEKNLADLPALDWQQFIKKLEQGEAVLEQETSLLLSSQKILPVSVSASKLTDSAGKFCGYLFILRDLAEIRRLQKQVKINERLSALGSMAAGVAHEIRNPLGSIKGYVTFLTEKLKDDPKAYATGQMLINETERLNRVVSDLLSVARPLELKPQPILPSQVLQQAARLLQPDLEEKNINLKLLLPDFADKKEELAELDADRLTQAILNLLLNAVQAIECKEANETPDLRAQGEIALSLETLLDESCKEYLCLKITDNGCGMSPETMSRLFTPYFTTKAAGSGLGLTISQQIVEQHGGEINVFSLPNEGSTFTIKLPLKK